MAMTEISKKIHQNLEELAARRLKKPEEELWATLAALGWIAPALADDWRRRMHEQDLKLAELSPSSSDGVSPDPGQPDGAW